jgi:hypothetical protein
VLVRRRNALDTGFQFGPGFTFSVQDFVLRQPGGSGSGWVFRHFLDYQASRTAAHVTLRNKSRESKKSADTRSYSERISDGEGETSM